MTPQEPARRGAGQPEEEEETFSGPAEDEGPREDTDVFLDVPKLDIEELNLEVDNLRAVVSAKAELADFLNINIGVDAYLENVKLEVKGVEAQAQLKVNLERILGSIDKALAAIDKNPQLLDPSRRKKGGPGDPGGSGASDLPSALPAGEPAAGEPNRADPADPVDPAERATQAARTKAEELGVDLDNVRGTGAGGRILVRDVTAAG